MPKTTQKKLTKGVDTKSISAKDASIRLVQSAKKEPKYYALIFTGLILLIFAIASAYLMNYTSIKDRIASLLYTPTAEISNLEQKIGFTDNAIYTFRATRPALEGREQFNKDCRSHNADISVLGCYTGGNIYIYNIVSDELAGIVESTAAHEFLHAAWDRLPESEQNIVSRYLNQVYAEHHDELSEDLSTYDTADQLDELHSRIGTQIADLPDYLERYYANYFKDQDAVVAYYDHYISPFRQLKSQLAAITTELDELKATIDADTANYYKRAEALSSAIDEFNDCANQAGCFASSADFSNRRSELVAEQDSVEELYSKINSAVDQYNQKVEEYNNSLLRTEELQNAINSNAKINQPIDN